MTTSIRGATTVERNNKDDIISATEILLTTIIRENNLSIDNITSILFSCTKDLNQVYPAAAARNLGITRAGLMCFDELFVEGSLPMCIRVMVNGQTEAGQPDVRHIYLNGAKVLRPDIPAEENRFFSIALDGPSGAGKSTVAKACAKRLGFSYIDTGAMYRAFAYYCIQNGIDTGNTAQVDLVADTADIAVKFENGVQRVFSDGEDVSLKIRTQTVAEHTSKVSAIPSVRKRLVRLQQELAKGNHVIMDGRDIGTVVLKDSPLKIYLDASSETRAKRRMNELRSMGQAVDFDTILAEVNSRDYRDMNRDADPLRKAGDAVKILSDNMDAAEVCAVICALAIKRMGEGNDSNKK